MSLRARRILEMTGGKISRAYKHLVWMCLRLAAFDGRRVDELECVISVLLAIAFAHAIKAQNIWWAAFSGYRVMRGHVAESVLRGILRIVGTAAGAVLALWIVPLVERSVVLTLLSLAMIGGTTLYASLTAKHSYAWLFVGLTFAMILLDKLEHPSSVVVAFARTRILETIAGTMACMLVSALSTVTLRRRWPAERGPPDKPVGWHPHAARHAAQGSVALALVPLVGALWNVPELSQSAVTIMAVMLLPISSIGVSGLKAVTRRLLHRVVGCIAGAGFAAPFLFTARGSTSVLIAGLMLGVILGRHLENGRGSLAYAGVQFTLAVLVVLVPDSYASAEIEPALGRLIGILIGVALLEPVLVLWHAAQRLPMR
jgi:uncharacterized membrane protein YccC